MLYFSELNNLSVVNGNKRKIGRLDDLIFSFSGTPYITKIIVSKRKKGLLNSLLRKKINLIIPIEYVEKIDNEKVLIKNDFKEVEIQENELYVKKNLLDTQVIDIEENNIVRVNDVLIQTVNSHGFVIYGGDIGVSGILRWFKLDRFINKFLRLFGKYYIPESTLAWSDIQPLELSRGRVVIKTKFNNLKKLHPADVADYLETQNFKNVTTLIEGIDKEYLAEVISELNPHFQINLLKRMPYDQIALIISIMDPDDAVDVISQFSPKKQEIILAKVPSKEASEVRRLLKFSVTPLGEYLNTEFLAVPPEDAASNVIKKIKDSTSYYSTLEYIYVVNKDNQLIGVFDLHELLLQNSDTPVYKFMISRLVSANLNTPIEIAFRRMSKYKIASLPVIDEKRKILGIVLIEDLSKETINRSN